MGLEEREAKKKFVEKKLNRPLTLLEENRIAYGRYKDYNKHRDNASRWARRYDEGYPIVEATQPQVDEINKAIDKERRYAMYTFDNKNQLIYQGTNGNEILRTPPPPDILQSPIPYLSAAERLEYRNQPYARASRSKPGEIKYDEPYRERKGHTIQDLYQQRQNTREDFGYYTDEDSISSNEIAKYTEKLDLLNGFNTQSEADQYETRRAQRQEKEIARSKPTDSRRPTTNENSTKSNSTRKRNTKSSRSR